LDSSKSLYRIVMGDFNAKVGTKQNSDKNVGNFGFGKRNKRGDKLVEFTEVNKLLISNTFFKKKPQKMRTWKGSNMIKNENRLRFIE